MIPEFSQLEELPDELLFAQLSLLSPFELSKLAQTSVRLRSLCADEKLWQAHLARDFLTLPTPTLDAQQRYFSALSLQKELLSLVGAPLNPQTLNLDHLALIRPQPPLLVKDVRYLSRKRQFVVNLIPDLLIISVSHLHQEGFEAYAPHFGLNGNENLYYLIERQSEIDLDDILTFQLSQIRVLDLFQVRTLLDDRAAEGYLEAQEIQQNVYATARMSNELFEQALTSKMLKLFAE